MQYLSTLLALTVFSGSVVAMPSAPMIGRAGMVSTDHKAASEAGAKMLSQGGDAADAAVAAALMLGVVSPLGSGIGGGGFAVVNRKDGRHYSLDFREVAPGKATRDMFLDDGGKPIPNASRRGPKAAGFLANWPAWRSFTDVMENCPGRRWLAQLLRPLN